MEHILNCEGVLFTHKLYCRIINIHKIRLVLEYQIHLRLVSQPTTVSCSIIFKSHSNNGKISPNLVLVLYFRYFSNHRQTLILNNTVSILFNPVSCSLLLRVSSAIYYRSERCCCYRQLCALLACDSLGWKYSGDNETQPDNQYTQHQFCQPSRLATLKWNFPSKNPLSIIQLPSAVEVM